MPIKSNDAKRDFWGARGWEWLTKVLVVASFALSPATCDLFYSINRWRFYYDQGGIRSQEPLDV